MIIRTELVTVQVLYKDAVLTMAELSTTDEASIAVLSKELSPGAALRRQFVRSVKAWENIEDENGPLPCTDENKEMVFDANKDMMESVMSQHRSNINDKIEKEKKISKNGQSGI